MITTPEQMREAAARDKDLIRRGDAFEAAELCTCGDCFTGTYRAIRAIPIAPQPATNWTACAADMLRVWDTWFGGSADGDHASADRLAIASAFAAQAFEHAASSGITADGAPTALLRAFLLALIDKLHPDLDYLRADPASGEKARAERGAVAPPVVAAPQPVAVTVKPLVDYILQDDLHNRLIPRVVDIAYFAWSNGRSGKNNDDGGPCDWVNDTKPIVDRNINKIRAALTIHPADPLSDPLSDPRVKALVEAARALRHSVCGPTGFADAVRHNSGQAYPWPSLDAAELALDAALRAIGGEA